MSAQDRFNHALTTAQSLSVTPEKMPYLCVVGTFDFDELKAEILRTMEWHHYHQRVCERLANEWDPFNTSDKHFDAFKERIEQEEFGREIVTNETPATSPVLAEAEAGLDPRQQRSLTDFFEYCGCKCFRSLDQPRGFWFA
jgi:hypothetical protein